MATSPPSLDDLRRRIDEIDDALHDLVMRRAALVDEIVGAKRNGNVPVLRPGREAQILRRLVERHRGRFPRGALLRLWRELIAGTVAMQGEFAVAVCMPGGQPGCWDLARDHYGGHVAMIVFHSVTEVLRALAEGRATVGVVPFPVEGDTWWQALALSGASAPRVMARLPFIGRGNGRGENGDALVVGHGDPDPTGADRSLIVIEAHRELSRARLIAALKGAGLPVTFFAAHEPAGDVAWYLAELDDHVTPADPRLAGAVQPLGERVARLAHLGYYARPLPPAVLAEKG